MTRAPAASASATVSSVLPESTTIRSSAQATEARQASMCAASLRVMIVAETAATRATIAGWNRSILPGMDRSAVLDLFRSSGALHEGHFRLSSGLHSGAYLQSALVLQHPAHAEALGRAIAELVRHTNPSVVMSPALGGLIIGHEVARALGVRAIFAERV